MGFLDRIEETGRAMRDRMGELKDQLLGSKSEEGEERDALAVLKEDHELVNVLFEQIEAMKRPDATLREGLFSQLKYELDTHASVEERIFYTALRKTEKGRALIPEALEEHRLVKELLTELASMKLDGEEWMAKLTVLKENVQHHVKEEEDELFPIAKEAFDEKHLKSMGAELQQEKLRQAAGGSAGAEAEGAERRPS